MGMISPFANSNPFPLGKLKFWAGLGTPTPKITYIH